MKKESDCQNRPCERRMYRRNLLKLAVAAATGLLATGSRASQEQTVPQTTTPPPATSADRTHSPEDFSRMAYCGIKCWAACPEKEYPDHCGGCKSEGGKRGHFCVICSIRKCASEKQVLTCAHCDEYPACEADTWTKYPILRDMIDRLRSDLQIKF